ncbi:hypothetical protein E8E12_006791 [Didymella heteroderae]|uniref:Uncharacterized protein n=1 Tax=Didymella heteroderae TaxID=1769908 RepID=A0A9P4WPP0_9PLEO|nr:hypothetical protein E8E12_006791 [Didymella heteroderae]
MILWFVRLCIRGRTLDLEGSVMSNILYDMMLVALWSYSAVIQSTGDYSDPQHIALRPWYLERECAEAWPTNRAGCRAAKASFGLALFAAMWFGVRCITTCMYGTYMYGKKSKDVDIVDFDTEKRSIHLPCEFD